MAPADGSEGDVVREEPGEPLVPDGTPPVVTLDRHGTARQARVDDEVRAPGDEARERRDERRAASAFDQPSPIANDTAAVSDARQSAPTLKRT